MCSSGQPSGLLKVIKPKLSYKRIRGDLNFCSSTKEIKTIQSVYKKYKSKENVKRGVELYVQI